MAHPGYCKCDTCHDEGRSRAKPPAYSWRRPCVIESPFAGDEILHRAYLRALIRHALAQGYTPYASHGLLPGALREEVPEERAQGIAVGIAMRDFILAHGGYVCFGIDLGWSPGMKASARSLHVLGRNVLLGPAIMAQVHAEAAAERARAAPLPTTPARAAKYAEEERRRRIREKHQP